MTSSDRATPPKATLFCPDCGHRSRYDGDWHVLTRSGTLTLECPDCRTEISSREPARSLTSPAAVWDRWSETLRTWQTLWWRRLTP